MEIHTYAKKDRERNYGLFFCEPAKPRKWPNEVITQ